MKGSTVPSHGRQIKVNAIQVRKLQNTRPKPYSILKPSTTSVHILVSDRADFDKNQVPCFHDQEYFLFCFFKSFQEQIIHDVQNDDNRWSRLREYPSVTRYNTYMIPECQCFNCAQVRKMLTP